MNFRSLARWGALAGLITTVGLAVPAPAFAAGSLPVCQSGPASTKAPTTRAGAKASQDCRSSGPVLESAGRMSRAGNAQAAGYTHLGAGTGSAWSGVTGRLSVVDGGIRAGTYDFVASRFMVKRDQGGGNIAWLEAGWAETGWAGKGRQHIYTYNTNSKTWQFYDQYKIRAGDRLWIDIHTDGNNVWQAWLWWNNRWNLLTAQKLPLGTSAYVEQYVEVYADPSKPVRSMNVPPVDVSNVSLYNKGSAAVRWRENVSTLTGGEKAGDLCVDWVTNWDTWFAGNCRPERATRR